MSCTESPSINVYYTHLHLWSDFGDPTDLSYLIFWEILIQNIELAVVL